MGFSVLQALFALHQASLHHLQGSCGLVAGLQLGRSGEDLHVVLPGMVLGQKKVPKKELEGKIDQNLRFLGGFLFDP